MLYCDKVAGFRNLFLPASLPVPHTDAGHVIIIIVIIIIIIIIIIISTISYHHNHHHIQQDILPAPLPVRRTDAGRVLVETESGADGVTPHEGCPELQVRQFPELPLRYLQHGQCFGHGHVSVEIGAALAAVSLLVTHQELTTFLTPDSRQTGRGPCCKHSAHFININIITSRRHPARN